MDDCNLQAIILESARKIGIEKLTYEQEKVIQNVVEGNDVFICLPTGSGKSICFALLPLIFDAIRSKCGSICLIVSPLTALMKDQVTSFQGRGLKAVSCASDQTRATQEHVRAGHFQLVYVTLESLVDNTYYRGMLLENVWRENMVAFVIDEAHCIKTW